MNILERELERRERFDVILEQCRTFWDHIDFVNDDVFLKESRTYEEFLDMLREVRESLPDLTEDSYFMNGCSLAIRYTTDYGFSVLFYIRDAEDALAELTDDSCVIETQAVVTRTIVCNKEKEL